MNIESINDKCNGIVTVVLKGQTIGGTINLIKNALGQSDNDSNAPEAANRPRQGYTRSKKPRVVREKNNMCLITVGDCGFKNKKVDTILKELSPLNESLAANGNFVFMLRNCDDNPSFFNENKISLSNIKLLPDVSILCSKKFGNILCIGGGVSYNKVWKEKFSNATGREIFFSNERTSINKDELNEILSKMKINTVVSYSCPSFCSPSDSSNTVLKKWVNTETDDLSYYRQERILMDEIYVSLLAANNIPHQWIYGLGTAFKFGGMNIYGDILFKSADSIKLKENSEKHDTITSLDFALNDFYQSPFNFDALRPFAVNYLRRDDGGEEEELRREDDVRADEREGDWRAFFHDAPIDGHAVDAPIDGHAVDAPIDGGAVLDDVLNF